MAEISINLWWLSIWTLRKKHFEHPLEQTCFLDVSPSPGWSHHQQCQLSSEKYDYKFNQRLFVCLFVGAFSSNCSLSLKGATAICFLQKWSSPLCAPIINHTSAKLWLIDFSSTNNIFQLRAALLNFNDDSIGRDLWQIVDLVSSK